jgi:branched-chain amino acid aminotransferase
MALPRHAFFRGRVVPYAEARIGVLTHGLNYGTGVFGGIRGYWNADEAELFVFRPHDHFRRFLESARLLDMTLPYTADTLTEALVGLIRTELLREDCYARPLAFFLTAWPAYQFDLIKKDDVLDVFVGSGTGRYTRLAIGTLVRVPTVAPICADNRSRPQPAHHSRRSPPRSPRRSRLRQAVVLNADGHISEGSAENFFLVKNGAAVTPPVTDNILEGVTRRTILELLREKLGVPVVERSIDRTELTLADEAFYCGTVFQIAAITRVDHRPIGAGRMGPVVSALRALYFDVVRGKHPEYRHWCHPIYSDWRPPLSPKADASRPRSERPAEEDPGHRTESLARRGIVSRPKGGRSAPRKPQRGEGPGGGKDGARRGSHRSPVLREGRRPPERSGGDDVGLRPAKDPLTSKTVAVHRSTVGLFWCHPLVLPQFEQLISDGGYRLLARQLEANRIPDFENSRFPRLRSTSSRPTRSYP